MLTRCLQNAIKYFIFKFEMNEYGALIERERESVGSPSLSRSLSAQRQTHQEYLNICFAFNLNLVSKYGRHGKRKWLINRNKWTLPWHRAVCMCVSVMKNMNTIFGIDINFLSIWLTLCWPCVRMELLFFFKTISSFIYCCCCGRCWKTNDLLVCCCFNCAFLAIFFDKKKTTKIIYCLHNSADLILIMISF